jgi:DNA polymerase-1
MKNHILAVDGANEAMRLFYQKGCRRAVDVVPHFRASLKRLVREWQPTHLIVALESETPCFRYALYADYKKNREGRDGPSATDVMREVVQYFGDWGVCSVTALGYEADDVLATLARKATHGGSLTSILSSDRDLWSTVKDGWVRCLNPLKGGTEIIREADVLDRLGVQPAQVAELKVMSGDRSDNIPSIGEIKQTAAGPRHYGFTQKRAAELLRQFGSIDLIYEATLLDGIGALTTTEYEWLWPVYGTIDGRRNVIRLVDDAPIHCDDYALSDVDNLT